jgi:sugar lactone lactonase YvrE
MFKRVRNFVLTMTVAICCAGLSPLAHGGGVTVYVANQSSGTVSEYSGSGTYLGNLASGLNDPDYVTVDRSGDVFVSVYGGQSIQEYSPQGNLLLTIPVSYSPGQVQVAANGNLLVSDYFGSNVFQYSPTGEYLGVFSSLGLSRAGTSTLDSSGNLYIADFDRSDDGGLIRKISPTGVDLGNFATGVGPVGGIAFNSTGDLYAVISGTPFGVKDMIVEYSATGVYLGVLTESGLDQPGGIAIGPDGNLYVANYGNNTIEEFSPSGVDLGVFASTGLNGPTGIAISSVPEPSSAVLLITAGLTILTYGTVRRRRR